MSFASPPMARKERRRKRWRMPRRAGPKPPENKVMKPMSKRRSSVVSVHEVGEWPELPMQSDRVLAVIETGLPPLK
jgi:hypothetical protein